MSQYPLPSFVRSLLIVGGEDVCAGREVDVVATHDPSLDSIHGIFDAVIVHSSVELPELLNRLGPFGRVYGNLPALMMHGLQLYGTETTWVRDNYDPITHATTMLEAGRPRVAIDIIESIPESFITEPERRLVACLHLQLAYLLLAETMAGPDRLRAFFRAQQQFYTAVYIFPLLPQLYEVQAGFWRLIGNEPMGARLVHSVTFATGEKNPPLPTREEPETSDPPPWDPAFKLRILIVGHRHSDYGMDVLYDGLVRNLGADRVSEYPYKPFLHGRNHELVGGYPCAFDHPSEPKALSDLARELRDGHYDILIYADVRRDTPRDEVLQLLDAGSSLPLFIVDTWDDGSDLQDILLEHIQRDRVDAYFKREMLRCWNYGPNAFPLPFAYPETRIVPAFSPFEGGPGGCEPREGFFWAGHRHFGLRRLYLETLERDLGQDLSQSLDPAEYQRSLQQALVALDCFGFGYDTVRYWEIPAHGAMLLAEKKPIHIPHDFKHGESCIHFHTAQDLVESVRHYLDHPEEAASIAQRGWQHLRTHHTSRQRARHLLGRIQQTLS